VKLRGLAKVELLFTLAAAVVNLRRPPPLLLPSPGSRPFVQSAAT